MKPFTSVLRSLRRKALASVLAAACAVPAWAADLGTFMDAADEGVARAETASARTQALSYRAEVLRLGNELDRAENDLRAALKLAPTPAERAYVLVAEGMLRRQTGQVIQARAVFSEAMTIAEAEGLDAVAAISAAELARLVPTAEAAGLIAKAEAGSDTQVPLLQAHIAIAKAAVAHDANGNPAPALAKAVGILETIIPNLPQGQLLLEAAEMAERAGDTPLALRAYSIAEDNPFQRIALLASDGRAGLVEAAGSQRQAAALAGNNLLVAQATGDDEIAFRAAWRRGRAFDALADGDGALQSYRIAFESLRRIRANLPRQYVAGQSLYRRQFGQFHQSFVDLLMRRQSETGDPNLLSEARTVIEDLKIDEVEDYFQERCVPREQNPARVADLGDTTAVLYPIVLPDRIELLLDFQGKIERRTSMIPEGALEALVRVLRFDLEIYGRDPQARSAQLYDLLIRPYSERLKEAETIVYIPDGILRLVPISPLWDGERFVIETHAVATVLGLSLVSQRSIAVDESETLVAGATQVKGFAPLPSVEQEVTDLVSRLGADALFQEDFEVERFSSRLQSRPYGLVHLATHAQVGGTPEDNFIAATDGRIDMNRLALSLRARSLETGVPVELLTLSACATAAGDDRAPLGLAGIAFRAGARSVLASLWPVFDVATAELMQGFYTGLDAGLSRAQALREAQLALIAKAPDFRHPSVWAAFMIIGDWH